MRDKLNHVDYHWFLVRTQPGHEQELCAFIEREKGKAGNILEAYCPTHTTINVRRGDNERKMPLFDGYVFVLATQGALADFLHDKYPNAFLRYNRKRGPEEKAEPCIIPENQMRAFKDFNENYADKVVVLERPYTDYAFNSNGDDGPNEVVRVLEGPLAGKEGYICRFRRKRGLVFQVQGIGPGNHLTVSYPNVYDLRVIRLHNAEGDRFSIGTEKARAADILIGLLQGCGYEGQTLPMLYDMVERLAVKPSLVALCKELHRQGKEDLSLRLARLTGKEAELILNLARYEHDAPGYIREACPKLVLRPFLTPTSGVELEEGESRAELPHAGFTEIIRKVDLTEEVYYPTKGKGGTVTTAYYAHIGTIKGKDGYVFFTNWDDFLGEYFLTTGKANEKLVGGTVQAAGKEGMDEEKKEKLIESFRNYAPILYKVLTDAGSRVKAVADFKVGGESLNVMMITEADFGKGTEELIHTCVRICQEINTTNHLAVWRRYLRTVWLHQ